VTKKENIFQPHRSHLYQYLANEMGILMFCCNCLCGTQLGINGIIIYKATKKFVSVLCFSFLLVMTFVYLGIRAVIMRQVSKVGKDYLFYIRLLASII
jgi:hypothetical protein